MGEKIQNYISQVDVNLPYTYQRGPGAAPRIILRFPIPFERKEDWKKRKLKENKIERKTIGPIERIKPNWKIQDAEMFSPSP